MASSISTDPSLGGFPPGRPASGETGSHFPEAPVTFQTPSPVKIQNLLSLSRNSAALLGLLGLSQLSAGVVQAAPAVASAPQHHFEIGADAFLLDGKPLQIRCGELHAARVPQEYWRHRLRLIKAMGLNTVCAYLFWNMHEPRPGEYNWSGQADAAAFCRIAQEEGLWVILRPGPYACAEWEMGGFP